MAIIYLFGFLIFIGIIGIIWNIREFYKDPEKERLEEERKIKSGEYIVL